MDGMMTAQWAGSFSRRVAMLALAARNVTPEKLHVAHILLSDFAIRLDKLALLMKDLQRDPDVQDNAEFTKVEKREMEADVTAAEQLIEAYTNRCPLSLLLGCPRLLKQLQKLSANLSRSLNLFVPEVCSPAIKLQVLQTQQFLEQQNLKLGVKEQAIVESLGVGNLNSIASDPALGDELALQISECLGVSLNSDAFLKDLATLKSEEGVDVGEDKAYSFYLEQCILLLERAVVRSKCLPVTGVEMGRMIAASPPSRERSMRNTPLQPLQSFICPITREVMKDPVQIASGQTYERTAIERWFAAGHTRCPMGVELKNTKMKSNFALRQSIAEWRERNYSCRLDIAEQLLLSEDLLSIDVEEQVKVLRDVQALCEEDTMNKYTIASRGLLAPLVHLIESRNLEIRKTSCSALFSLAQDNDDNQELMVKEGLIDLVVRCLARQFDEAQQAVLLLRLLSEKPKIAEMISHAQGAVLLLVTLLGCDHKELVPDVKAVLENVPASDDNVVIMAEANLLTPLVLRLVRGATASKIVMAKTLARLHMPSTSKVVASTHDSIVTLTNMMNSANEDEQDSAISALENLSTVDKVGRMIADCSGLEILIRLLTSAKSSASLKTRVSQVIANVLVALGDEWHQSNERDLDLESYVNRFLSFMGPLTPPTVQGHLLRGLLGLAKGEATRVVAIEKMKERQGFNVLIPLLKGSVPSKVRHYAIQLFCCLSRVFGSEACAALKEQPDSLHLLVEIIQRTDSTEVEIVSATSILGDLPTDDSNVTAVLQKTNVVISLARHLGDRNAVLVEAAAGALLRFSSPTQVELQQKLAELGVIPKFVSVLDLGRNLAKERAATALANFSASTPSLVRPVSTPKFWMCFAPRAETCLLHAGLCSVETSFCLLEADAIAPLLAVLKEGDPQPAEAALVALNTLVDDRTRYWERGCHVIAKAKGIPLIISMLSKGTPHAQEVSVNMCEKFFRLEQYRDNYGGTAQMHIISVAQNGGPNAKRVAGRILRQLDLLHSQSNYFGTSIP